MAKSKMRQPKQNKAAESNNNNQNFERFDEPVPNIQGKTNPNNQNQNY